MCDIANMIDIEDMGTKHLKTTNPFKDINENVLTKYLTSLL